jgi:hypothetical protein
MLKDRLGNDLKIGDTVAFGKRVGNYGKLGVGKVESLIGQRVSIRTESGRITGRIPEEVLKAYCSELDMLLA